MVHQSVKIDADRVSPGGKCSDDTLERLGKRNLKIKMMDKMRTQASIIRTALEEIRNIRDAPEDATESCQANVTVAWGGVDGILTDLWKSNAR